MAAAMGGAGDAAVAAASVGLAPDLKKRIDIMAGHVARAGLDFERSVRAKNSANPQFAFLVGGEGAEYYQALRDAQRAAAGGGGGGGGAAAGSSSAAEIADLLGRWPEPRPQPLGAELEGSLAQILAGLEHMASRDAIRNGREWLEANSAAAAGIAGSFMQRIRCLQTCAHRLHLLFLLHDVLQAEAARTDLFRPILTAFRPFLAWILRPAFQLAQSAAPSEEPQKILKLLSLWQERGILGTVEATEIRQLVTVAELPPPSLRPSAPPSSLGLAPGLLQQVQAQVQAQQAQQQPQAPPQVVPPPPPPPPVLQGIPVSKPQQQSHPQQQAALALQQAPSPNFSGVLQPGMPAGAGFPPGVAVQMQPGAAALQTLAAGRGARTPETVPVGVMASMLKQVSRRGKDLHTAFVPYKPLDPLYTPQTPPPTAPTTARLMERLAEFYDIVGDCAREPAAPALSAVPPPAGERPAEDAKLRSRSRSPVPGTASRVHPERPAEGTAPGAAAAQLGSPSGAQAID